MQQILKMAGTTLLLQRLQQKTLARQRPPKVLLLQLMQAVQLPRIKACLLAPVKRTQPQARVRVRVRVSLHLLHPLLLQQVVVLVAHVIDQIFILSITKTALSIKILIHPTVNSHNVI